MKRGILLIIGLLLIGGLGANALQQMLELEENGVRNADLYYNIGVAYWQTGQSGMANLYFLRSLNLNSAHKPAKENLDYVIALSQDKDLYPQRPFLLRIFYASYDFMNLNRMAVLSLILFALTGLCLHWLLHYDPLKERGLPTLVFVIVLLLFLSSVGFLGSKAYRQQHNNRAVLISARVDLRAGASMGAARIAVLHEAAILRVEKREKLWCLVHSPDGKRGWLKNEDVAWVINPAR